MILDDSSRDRRLHQVLGEYYEAAGIGPEPDRGEWIARHPDLAAELADFFDGQDRLRALASPIPGPSTAPGDFGGYRVVCEIARGGMGVVFEARQECLDRPVALKMILAGAWASEADLRRFQIEAEAASVLDHPHILPIYEVGQHRGLPFYSMKLMPGGTLAGRMGGGPEADPRRAAETVATIALAVHHAHQRGVLHRDLKPSNILLDAEGRPHVADFGLARWVEARADDDLTRTGAVLGSPPYMAPEQAAGRREAVSTATDVHGLGTILYALLTGQAPFRGGSALEILERVRNDPPAPPSKANPKVDRDLETICLKCLEKDPDRRYSSAEALADDLGRWLRREPIAARAIGPAGRAWRWCRRRPRAALVVATAAILAVATVAGLVATVRAQAEALAQDRRATDHFGRLIHGLARIMLRLHDRTVPDSPELRAMRLDASSRAIEILRGVIDARGGAFDERMDAASAFQHVAEIDFLRGEAGAGFRDLEASVAAFEALTAEFPGRQNAFRLLGQAHHILALRMAAEGRPAAGVTEHSARAAAAYQHALEAEPDDPGSIRYSSWFLAISPDPRFRDPERAVALARRGLGNVPGFGSRGMWSNLGVALYRAGRYDEAVEALETSARTRGETDATLGFFLAMAHARLGHPAEARRRFEEASVWMDRNNPTHHELILFRAEARETISRSATTRPAAESSENRPPRAR